ncbi:MAG: DNA repair protein RadC [Ignavibacteria bacterium]|nr:DNA repair protein RadC [Ignavibacteria bacterium]
MGKPANASVVREEAPRNVIREWPECDRPREKCMARGASALSDTELLAIIINAGSGERSAIDIARDLVGAYSDLRALSRRPLSELMQRRGIGPARAVAIAAAFELGKRQAAIGDSDSLRVQGPEDVAQRYIPIMRDLPTERFIALLLNNAGRVIREHLISQGSVSASIVHPREVFHAAVTEHASAIILLHNHPSGVRTASHEDRAVTKQLIEAGRLMDIPIRDHVIICGSGYVSFAEQGWMA